MGFDIQYNPEKHYLHVEATGDLTLAAARKYLEDVAQVLEETGANRILIDVHKGSMRLSAMDLITLRRMVSESAESDCRRALVDQTGRSGLEFFESITRSHGESMRAFTDLDKALAWLLSDSA